MAHGAGGKATQTLIEGLFVPAFGGGARATRRRRRGRGRRRRAGADHRLIRGQAAALPRRLDRRARGQRDGQRPRRVGRAAARAERCRWCSRRGCPPTMLRAEVEAIAAAAEAAGVEIVAGDTKVVERGHADGMYVCTDRRSARRDPRAQLSPAALRPGDRILLSGRDRRARDGDHAGPRRVRARRRDRVGHAARCGRRSTRCSRRPGRACAACATPPAAASRRCSTSWPGPRRWR